jgi:nucleotide-binding universal stress UspA family protein
MKKVLVALDGSTRSERSLPWVKLLAGEPELTLLRVIEPIYALDVYAGTLLADLQEDVEKYLAKMAGQVGKKVGTIVRTGPAAATILDVAAEIGADLIVATTHGGSKAVRRVFGGTTEQLLHGSDVPLLVVPSWISKPPVARINKIVVPLDGSQVSEMILPLAWRLAQERGAEIVLTHVLTGPEDNKRFAELDGHFRSLVEDLDKSWATAKVHIVRGKLPGALLDAIENEKADVVVMSAHGHGAMKRMLVGSDTSALIRETPVPVLVARYDALKKLSKASKKVAQVR